MEKIRIRPAVPDDAPVLASLAEELGYPAVVEDMYFRLTDLLARTDHAVLVAHDDRTVGWIHVTLQRTLEAGTYALIAGLVVTGSRRGLGVGSRLVAAAEEWAAAQGMVAVRVASNVLRERTHLFYRKLGYIESKQQKVFGKPLRRRA
ncbi:MAG: GNAT family N-acetyltransferase [Gammaproteobacteria bacterium]|nr:GNAT family N-acetyltransferase [Gammaproteobacteria bacterium]